MQYDDSPSRTWTVPATFALKTQMFYPCAELNLAHNGNTFEAIKDMERVWELPFLDLLPTKTNL